MTGSWREVWNLLLGSDCLYFKTQNGELQFTAGVNADIVVADALCPTQVIQLRILFHPTVFLFSCNLSAHLALPYNLSYAVKMNNEAEVTAKMNLNENKTKIIIIECERMDG